MISAKFPQKNPCAGRENWIDVEALKVLRDLRNLVSGAQKTIERLETLMRQETGVTRHAEQGQATGRCED